MLNSQTLGSPPPPKQKKKKKRKQNKTSKQTSPPKTKEAQVISPTACGALFSARTTPQPSQNLVEPSWNLTSGPPRTTPEQLSAVMEKHTHIKQHKQTTPPPPQRKRAAHNNRRNTFPHNSKQRISIARLGRRSARVGSDRRR